MEQVLKEIKKVIAVHKKDCTFEMNAEIVYLESMINEAIKQNQIFGTIGNLKVSRYSKKPHEYKKLKELK